MLKQGKHEEFTRKIWRNSSKMVDSIRCGQIQFCLRPGVVVNFLLNLPRENNGYGEVQWVFGFVDQFAWLETHACFF